MIISHLKIINLENQFFIMIVAVIGAGDCDSKIYRLAEETGALLGQKGYTTICGGLGGVMEAVCKGAKSSGGKTIGILPGSDPKEANSFVDFPIATGMGIGRNIVIIRSAEVVIAINGKYGTLSELAFALQLNKPVIGLQTWEVSNEIIKVDTPQEALQRLDEIHTHV